VIEDIQSTIAALTSEVEKALAEVNWAQNEYNTAQLAESAAASQLSSDQDLVASLSRQLATDVAQLQIDATSLGVSKQTYVSNVELNDLLAARYAANQPVFAKAIRKLQHDELALIDSAKNQATTIDCKLDSECQDGNDGSLTFFAKLACIPSGTFVCDIHVDACACGF